MSFGSDLLPTRTRRTIVKFFAALPQDEWDPIEHWNYQNWINIFILICHFISNPNLEYIYEQVFISSCILFDAIDACNNGEVFDWRPEVPNIVLFSGLGY